MSLSNCAIFIFSCNTFIKGEFMAWLQTLLAGHSIVVGIALFTMLSTFLTALGTYLKSIGDQVPSWLGTIIGWTGSAIHFLNGISAPAVTPPSGS
jgi:hypothetical protein